MIQLSIRPFPSSTSSLSLHVTPPPYSTHTFLLQTAQQFTEPLDTMLNTLDTSLIISQGTLRPLWPMMLSGLWPLPSQMQLPSMYEEEKVLRFLLRIQDHVLTLMIIRISLSSNTQHHQCLLTLPFLYHDHEIYLNSNKSLQYFHQKKSFSRSETQLFFLIETFL